ncbi:hypothetical protein V8E36_000996 [Tilletia maclaganii]
MASASTSTSTAATALPFAAPTPGASLLLSHTPTAAPSDESNSSTSSSGKAILIIGSGNLATSRTFAALEAGLRPLLLPIPSASSSSGEAASGAALTAELEWRASQGQVEVVQPETAWDELVNADRGAWEKLIDRLDVSAHAGANDDNDDAAAGPRLFAVCVTDTLTGSAPTIKEGSSSTASSPLDLALRRAALLLKLCRRRRILLNVADRPQLCDFSFPAAHRFQLVNSTLSLADAPSSASSLQIAITTNGKGCRLASRIRREIVSALPRNVGDAVETVGWLRSLAKDELRHATANQTQRKGLLPKKIASSWTEEGQSTPRRRGSFSLAADETPGTPKASKSWADKDFFLSRQVEEEDTSYDPQPLNSPVPQTPLDRSRNKNGPVISATDPEQAQRRMRWVSQISEYWPIDYLGSLRNKPEELKELLAATSLTLDKAKEDVDEERGRRSTRPEEGSMPSHNAERSRSVHSLSLALPPSANGPRGGHVYLLGSGPGHPGLLTQFAHQLLTSPSTDLVLSDKLVPASVLALIPPTTQVEIARKFPGNAEAAQSELIDKALAAARDEGKTVVRLKQGDPFVYGRGGEEVLAFRAAGVGYTVVPGISSAFAGPLMLGIAVTQRGAADTFVLCTGVGRGGKNIAVPGYQRSTTLAMLMGVARLKSVVHTLTSTAEGDGGAGDGGSGRRGAAYPPYLPAAIIERASSPDQRLVASTLENIVGALERCGEQRPPGMILVGWTVLALEGSGDATILDDGDALAGAELEARDRQRVERWLGGKGFIMREGLDGAYAEAVTGFLAAASS